MSASLSSKPLGVGGLCHLVEAATALSKLVEVPKKDDELSAAPSVVLPSPEKAVISDDDESCKKNATAAAKNKKEIFPQRLLAILNDESLSDVVTWLPNGRSFVIVRPDVFTDQVLPKYLPPVDARGSTKYPSFTRKLNRWGFRQITRGPDTGAFHHPLFRRDEPDLCLQMVCQRSRDRRSNNGSTKSAAGAANTVPPKKRTVGDASGTLGQIPQTKLAASPPTLAAACVSSDENSASSSNASAPSVSIADSRLTLLKVALPASTVGNSNSAAAPVAANPQGVQCLSKDQAVIQSAIRQSVENERIRIAKAMLYHSYMQALGASGR